MAATSELQSGALENDARRRENAASPPTKENYDEQYGGLLGSVFSGAAGEPSTEGTARLLGSSAFSHSANSGPRAISLKRTQQSHGNHFTQRVIKRVQRKSALQNSAGGLDLPESQDETPIPADSPGQPLDERTRGFMESDFDTDFRDVLIHTDSHAAASAKALGANAYTNGRDIYFAAGMYAPESDEGTRLLAHELVHTIQQQNQRLHAHELPHMVQQQASAAPGRLVSQPTDAAEQEATRISDEVMSRPVSVKEVPAAFIQRQPVEGTQTVKPSAGRQQGADIPEAVRKRATYAATVFHRMSPMSATDESRLAQIVGAARVYGLILQRRGMMTDLDYEESRGMGILRYAPTRRNELQRVIDLIDMGLAELGIADEDELLHLVHEIFPVMVLQRAKNLALSMLDENEALALAEQERYSKEVCSFDTEGLLEADAELGRIADEIYFLTDDPRGLKARSRDIIYRHGLYSSVGPGETPSAGVYDPTEWEKYQAQLAEMEARTSRNRTTWEQLEQKRTEYAIRFPILAHRGYVPGSFSLAPREQLAQLVAGPVREIIANINQVREVIWAEELKVWNLRDVIEMTLVEMGVENEIVLKDAVQEHVQRQVEDESFIEKALAALAVVTTIVAGILTAPMGGWGGALVGGLWGGYFLYKGLQEYSMESAAENVALDEEFRSLAKQAGDQFVTAGRLPPGYRFRFELTAQAERGGSRLDVLIEDPLGQLIEVDWKTTGRSALSSKTVKQMEKHAAQVADPMNFPRVQARIVGQQLASQRSFSWTDEVRSAWEQLVRDDPALAQSVAGVNPATVQIQWP
jgi:hypothetical protein